MDTEVKYDPNLVGYARVSTTDQNLDHQIAALKKAGVHPNLIMEEKASAKNTERPVFAETLRKMERGQVLVVCDVSRFSRSLKDLINVFDDMRERGIDLKVLDQNVDTTTASGRAMFAMSGIFAQLHRELQREKQEAGIRIAQQKGKYKGSKIKITADAVRPLFEAGFGPAQIAAKLECSRQTIYNVIARAGLQRQ